MLESEFSLWLSGDSVNLYFMIFRDGRCLEVRGRLIFRQILFDICDYSRLLVHDG